MENYKFLSSFNLKLIAIVTMFIDHFAIILINNNYNLYLSFRIIGRIAFPIFAFLIAEGFFYTRNKYKYLSRLLIFSIISEIPFDIAFHNAYLEFEGQNVFLTLSIGLIAIIVFDKLKKKDIFISVLIVLALSIIASLLRTDYGGLGVLLIFSMYFFRGNYLLVAFSVVSINFIMIYDNFISIIKGNIPFNLYNIAQIFAVLSLIFIYFYNNKKGKSFRYLFYIFYPAHLLLLFAINYLLRL